MLTDHSYWWFSLCPGSGNPGGREYCLWGIECLWARSPQTAVSLFLDFPDGICLDWDCFFNRTRASVQ